MKRNRIQYHKIRVTAILLFCFSVAGFINAQEKSVTKTRLLNLTLKVTDAEGKIIPDASVVVGEGYLHAQSDENGKLAFKASPEDFITVSAPGYEKSVVLAGSLTTEPVVQLSKAKLFKTSDDWVPLPFMTLKKRQATGGYNVLKGSILDKYPSTDFRNSFTGLATGVDVREINGSPGLSAEEELTVFGITEKVSLSSRGRNMMYIIDEIPTDITEMQLDPGEIESVTIVKDIVGKTLYGPAGAEGIIFIKTKRGRENERILNVNMETGMSTIDRMPEWVSGADYARLNNMARFNSGLDPIYTDADIAAYEKNDPYDLYHPSVDYFDMILKKNMAFRRVNVSSTGGTDRIQYFAYLGYNGEGDIYKIGSTSDYNRLNVRSNIDVKVNDFLKVKFDFFGGLTYRRSPNYDWDPQFTEEDSDNPALSITEFPSMINDITTTPPIAFPVYAKNDSSMKSPWYGVSGTYGQNPIGNMEKNGYYTESGRNATFNVSLDYDMSAILKGLTSRTYIGFNAFNLLRVGKAEDYIAYIAAPGKTTSGADTIRLSKVHDGVDQANQAKLHDFYYMRFAAYETLGFQKEFGKSSLQTDLTFFLSRVARDQVEDPYRQLNGIFSALYSFNDKYSLHGVLNYAGSCYFSEKERYQLSGSAGASWIISEEEFMSGLKFIDYFKLRSEYGVLAYESYFSPFAYRDDWNAGTVSNLGPYSSSQWFGSSTVTTQSTTPGRTGNPGVTWEKRREFNAGIEMLMAKRKIYFELNYYNNLRDGMITQMANLPLVAGISSWLPRYNYNQVRYYGLETALQFTGNTGRFNYSFGGNASLRKSRIERLDELNYRYDYLFSEGGPADAIRGLTYLGKFASDEEVAQSTPQLYDDVLHQGDLKYKDTNVDGYIDDLDYSVIGNSSPRLVYSLNVRLGYKNAELTIIGTGRAFYDIMLNSQYYWNGWGDNTYSKFVRDNIGGDYPKLTYYKVENNFRNSTFWMRDAGFFKLQNVELAYNIPVDKLSWSGLRGFRIFARGANLFTLSDIKDVDPESINSGVEDYPLFRTFTGGIKLTF